MCRQRCNRAAFDNTQYEEIRSVDEPEVSVEERLKRLERAVSAMAMWLVQARTGFNAKDAEGIEKILKGELTGG
jgi:hypothetical protein